MRKAVEQRFHGTWVDTHAVVTHIDEDVVMVPSKGDRNRSTAVLVREGIVDQGGYRPAKRGTRPEYDEISYGCRAIRFDHEAHAGRRLPAPHPLRCA